MKFIAPYFILLNLILVTACHDKPETIKHPLSSITQTAPLSPVLIKADVPTIPLLAIPLTINLSLRTYLPITSITLKYTLSDGLTSVDPQMEFLISQIVQNQPILQSIHVVPTAEGAQTINVYATLQLENGQQITEPLTVSVTVGTPEQKAFVHPYQQHMHKDKEGRPTIVLPAEETRRQDTKLR